MADIKSFPNNQDEYIGAEYVMKWLHGRTSGVFGAGSNATVAALATPAMAVTVSDGVGWMSNANADGIVWWNDNEATTASKLELPISSADSTLDRITRIIVEWETTNYVDYPSIKTLDGTASGKPAAPELTNNSTVRQISLAQIYVPAGTTEITASMITDERLDASVCGLVTDTVVVDTSVMQNQFEALLAAIQKELVELEAGTGVELKKHQFNNVSVLTSDFTEDTTYVEEGYNYRAAVALDGVIESMIPEVIFGMADAIGGNFAPVAESYNGGVYIYAAEVPEMDITVPTIICWRGTAG